jgi:hypothetical protein
MYRVARAALLVLVFAGPLGAQTFSLNNSRVTRLMFDTETGSDSGLGFKMPHLAVGLGVEQSIGKHFELQGRVSYSPDKKYITNDGNSLSMKSSGLYWIKRSLALTGSLRHSNLWTSQFNKSSWAPSAGIAIREDTFGLPGRFYFEYLFPTGCQWGASCPIQSSRTKGAEIYWETRIASHVRLGLRFGFYRILNQSNQFRPDIPRTGEVTGNTLIILRYEFPRGSIDSLY